MRNLQIIKHRASEPNVACNISHDIEFCTANVLRKVIRYKYYNSHSPFLGKRKEDRDAALLFNKMSQPKSLVPFFVKHFEFFDLQRWMGA